MPGSFDIFSEKRLNKRLNRQSRRRWFETPSYSLSRHFCCLSLCCISWSQLSSHEAYHAISSKRFGNSTATSPYRVHVHGPRYIKITLAIKQTHPSFMNKIAGPAVFNAHQTMPYNDHALYYRKDPLFNNVSRHFIHIHELTKCLLNCITGKWGYH